MTLWYIWHLCLSFFVMKWLSKLLFTTTYSQQLNDSTKSSNLFRKPSEVMGSAKPKNLIQNTSRSGFIIPPYLPHKLCWSLRASYNPVWFCSTHTVLCIALFGDKQCYRNIVSKIHPTVTEPQLFILPNYSTRWDTRVRWSTMAGIE